MNTDRFLLAMLLAALSGTGRISRAAPPVLPPATSPSIDYEKSIPTDAMRDGLMSALGDSFEYFGSEIEHQHMIVGSWGGEWWWIAKVRAKVAGDFGFSYAIRFNLPPGRPKFPVEKESAVCTFPIKIGDLDARRDIVKPGAFGGAAWPHANVGDTLLIAINVDPYRIGHTFARNDPKDTGEAGSFWVVARDRPQWHKRPTNDPAVVHLDAADWVNLLDAWDSGTIDRPLRFFHHTLYAQLEFKKRGEFTLHGCLEDAKEKGAAGDDAAFRVVSKDKPVTVTLEYFDYTERAGRVTSTSSGSIPPGPLEARVGDRVLIECGRYLTPAKEKAPAGRAGIVTTQPVGTPQPLLKKQPK